LKEVLEELKQWDVHKCPFNEGFEVICNEHLLAAEALRGRAVVFRKEKKLRRAAEFYLQADAAADRAIEASQRQPGIIPVSERVLENTLWDEHDQRSPFRVKADVSFSHGYFWFEQREYGKAKDLFKESIGALERANERWDSPYTRLAIIQLCQGDYEAAKETFTKASVICKETPLARNREAPLSLALCTLGLRVIEICGHDGSPGDPMSDLEKALSKEPRLKVGPLECHRDDAKHLLIDLLEQARRIIDRFIQLLDRAIDDIVHGC
jgi:tetratricopeptide (TPR) repeat protein